MAIISTDSTYTFTVTSDRTLIAVFEPIPVYIITATIDPSGSGTVTGAGQYQEGATVTLVAAAGDGYEFSGWQEGGQTVSTGATYTFTATADRALVAAFEEASQYEPGVDWWATTLPSSANWYGIAYGDGKFVATTSTNSNKAAYSTDGINWTAATLPSAANWMSVAYGGGKFVVIAQNSRSAAYSTDGINWTSATLPLSINWASVTYGEGKFVAVAYGNRNGAYSTNGINWTSMSLPSSAGWQAIAYGGGTFVVATYNSNAAAYSNKYGPAV